MSLPEWVANTWWGFLIVIFALVLHQSKAWSDIWIWKKGQRQIGVHLDEIVKASAALKEVGAETPAGQHLTDFINVSTHYVRNHNRRRIGVLNAELRMQEAGMGSGWVRLLRLARIFAWTIIFGSLSLVSLSIGGMNVWILIAGEGSSAPESAWDWIAGLGIGLAALVSSAFTGALAAISYKDIKEEWARQKAFKKR